jgi:hypothetical protein
MPSDRVKIGTTVIADEVKQERKRFTNGHKTFNSSEAKSLFETQTRERRTKDFFEANKDSMIRPRNPLVGEITPRDKRFGNSLIPPGDPTPIPERKAVTSKIGALDMNDKPSSTIILSSGIYIHCAMFTRLFSLMSW